MTIVEKGGTKHKNKLKETELYHRVMNRSR